MPKKRLSAEQIVTRLRIPSFAWSARITTADVSIAIPAFNEIDNRSELKRRIVSTLVDVAW